jgi:hypothetical protein
VAVTSRAVCPASGSQRTSTLVDTASNPRPGCRISPRKTSLRSSIAPPGCQRRIRIRQLDDLPRHLLDEIEHLCNIYKDLEPGKSSSTAGFEGLEATRREIAAARARATSAEGAVAGADGPRVVPPGVRPTVTTSAAHPSAAAPLPASATSRRSGSVTTARRAMLVGGDEARR